MMSQLCFDSHTPLRPGQVSHGVLCWSVFREENVLVTTMYTCLDTLWASPWGCTLSPLCLCSHSHELWQGHLPQWFCPVPVLFFSKNIVKT